MELTEFAIALEEAKNSRKAIPRITDKHTFTVEDAYKVQNLLLGRALGRGEKLSGYKMGLTSRAKQKDVGVSQSIRGFLLEGGEIKEGEKLKAGSRIHPRVEPEVAMRFSKTLSGKVTFDDLREAVSWVGPAVEVIDSRFEGFSFSLPDVIADNCSGSGYLLGHAHFSNQLGDLLFFGVSVIKNGVIEQAGAPAAVLGNPFYSVIELIQELGKEGRSLEEGQVVLTGGITASVAVAPGDTIEFMWPGTTIQLVVEA